MCLFVIVYYFTNTPQRYKHFSDFQHFLQKNIPVISDRDHYLNTYLPYQTTLDNMRSVTKSADVFFQAGIL